MSKCESVKIYITCGLFGIAVIGLLSLGIYNTKQYNENVAQHQSRVYKISVPINAGGWGSSTWKHYYCNSYEHSNGDLVLYDCVSSIKVLIVDPERVTILEQ